MSEPTPEQAAQQWVEKIPSGYELPESMRELMHLDKFYEGIVRHNNAMQKRANSNNNVVE